MPQTRELSVATDGLAEVLLAPFRFVPSGGWVHRRGDAASRYPE